MSPDLGEISFLKALPIWAPANGSFPPLNSSSLLKFTKIPCAVSGLKNLIEGVWVICRHEHVSHSKHSIYMYKVIATHRINSTKNECLKVNKPMVLMCKYGQDWLDAVEWQKIDIHPLTCPAGPILVENMRLNSIGSVRSFPVSGDLNPYFSITAWKSSFVMLSSWVV